MTWAEYLSTDPDATCELQLAEESQREAIAVTETAYWTVSERSEPLYGDTESYRVKLGKMVFGQLAK